MNRPPALPLVVTVAGTAAICIAAFWLSYEALTDLADRSGITTPWLWPLIVDGLIVVATVAVVARIGSYAWSLLLAGAAISVAGNVLHASLPDGVLPVWLRATVAAVPPVALVAVTHLAVVLRRTRANSLDDAPTIATASAITLHHAAEFPQVNARDIASRSATSEPATGDGVAPADPAANEHSSRQLHLLTPTAATGATAEHNTRDVRTQAVALLDQGVPVCDIAEQLGVHRATVYRWRNAAS